MTVNVALVLCDMSISDEQHFVLAELSQCEELDEVSSDGTDGAAFDSTFKGSNTTDAAEVVSVFIDLEILYEESSLSDDFNGGGSTCGFCIFPSFKDSITASINI